LKPPGRQTPSTCHSDALFRDLTDRIALASAARGDAAAGFPGRLLTVRPADPETAWLGLPAPSEAGDGAAPALTFEGGLFGTGAQAGRGGSGGPAERQELSFSCLEDAVEAAADGDTIALLPGTHNVRAAGGLRLSRRVLIRGGGSGSGDSPGDPGGPSREGLAGTGVGIGARPAAAVIDHRGNAPLFRISRLVVLSWDHQQLLLAG
jgi:hypothetical protein